MGDRLAEGQHVGAFNLAPVIASGSGGRVAVTGVGVIRGDQQSDAIVQFAAPQ